MNFNIRKTIINWLPLAFALTVTFILVYISVQQNYRTEANDPQVQVAEDTAASFSNTVDPAKYVFGQKTDIAHSLAPFMIVYDSERKPVTFSGILGDTAPVPPVGTLEVAKNQKDHRFTWEPQKGLRLAAVVTYFSSTSTNASGYVLMARSLREIENRTASAGKALLLGWLLALVGSLWLAIYRDRMMDSVTMMEMETPVIVIEENQTM